MSADKPERWRKISTGWGSYRKWGPWHYIPRRESWAATAACGAGISRANRNDQRDTYERPPEGERLCPKCARAVRDGEQA